MLKSGRCVLFSIVLVAITSHTATCKAQSRTSANVLAGSLHYTHETFESFELTVGPGLDIPLRDEGVSGLVIGEFAWRLPFVHTISLVSQLDYSSEFQHEEVHDLLVAELIRYAFLHLSGSKGWPSVTEVFIDAGGGYLLQERVGVFTFGAGLQLFPNHNWGFGGRFGANIDKRGTALTSEIFVTTAFL